MKRREFTNQSVAVTLALIGSAFSSPGAIASGSKRLVGVLEDDPPMINPALTAHPSSYTAGSPVYSALTYVDAKGDLHPDLAKDWSISPDGLSYTFNLRKNVKWHDGRPFSAADVKFSLEKFAKGLHPLGRATYSALREVKIVDDHKVILMLERATPAMLISTSNLVGSILPKHIWENEDPLNSPYNRRPIGTGPFMLTEIRQGDRLIYKKNPNYHFPGQPAFDELVYRVIPDPAARLSAFESGDIDLLYSNCLPQTEVARVAKIPHAKIVTVGVAAPAYQCIFNLANPKLADIRVRHALAHGINREFLRRAVVPGLADAMVGPVPSILPLHNKRLTDYRFDVARAKSLLEEAGLKSDGAGTRVSFKLLYNTTDARANRIADIIKEQLRQVGVRIELVSLERATLIQRGYVAADFDILLDTLLLGPDPSIGVERLYNSKNIHNPRRPFTNNCGYVNAELDKLFAEEKLGISMEARRPAYDRIQEIIWKDLPILPLFSYRGANAYNFKTVAGVFDALDGSKDNLARAKMPG